MEVKNKKKIIIMCIAIAILIVMIPVIWYACTYQSSGRGHAGEYVINTTGIDQYGYDCNRYIINGYDENGKEIFGCSFAESSDKGYYYYMDEGVEVIKKFKEYRDEREKILFEAINSITKNVGMSVKLTHKYIKFNDNGKKYMVSEYGNYMTYNPCFDIDTKGEYNSMRLWMSRRYSNQKPLPSRDQGMKINIVKEVNVNGIYYGKVKVEVGMRNYGKK